MIYHPDRGGSSPSLYIFTICSLPSASLLALRINPDSPAPDHDSRKQSVCAMRYCLSPNLPVKSDDLHGGVPRKVIT